MACSHTRGILWNEQKKKSLKLLVTMYKIPVLCIERNNVKAENGE